MISGGTLLTLVREERAAQRAEFERLVGVIERQSEALARVATLLGDGLRAANPNFATLERESGAAELPQAIREAIDLRAGGDRDEAACLADFAIGRLAGATGDEAIDAVAKDIAEGADTSGW